jgi:hypothetical protein
MPGRESPWSPAAIEGYPVNTRHTQATDQGAQDILSFLFVHERSPTPHSYSSKSHLKF